MLTPDGPWPTMHGSAGCGLAGVGTTCSVGLGPVVEGGGHHVQPSPRPAGAAQASHIQWIPDQVPCALVLGVGKSVAWSGLWASPTPLIQPTGPGEGQENFAINLNVKDSKLTSKWTRRWIQNPIAELGLKWGILWDSPAVLEVTLNWDLVLNLKDRSQFSLPF